MKVFDILTENFPFHSNTTDMPFYDNMMDNPEYFERAKGIKSKVVRMSPDEYINTVSREIGVSADEMRKNRSSDKIKSFANQMKEGKKFPILTLDYTGGRLSQEGLHRSFAAKLAGVTEVPVLIAELTDEEKELRSKR